MKKASSHPLAFRIGRAFLALVAPLVPLIERRVWREEWESELWHGLRKRPSRTSAPRVWPYLRGCWKDALEVRRIERRRAAHRQGRPRGWPGRVVSAAMKGFPMMINELRLAARSLLKAPALAAAAILTLALGIGANTAIFSVIHGLLLRPLGYPGAERMVVVSTYNLERGLGPMSVAGPRLAHLMEGTRSLQAVSGYQPDELDLTGLGEARQVQAARLLSNMTALLDLRPQAGRTLTPSDFQPEAPAVVLLTDAFWRSHFGASPQAVGSTIRLNGREHTIAGVLRPEFELPHPAALVLPLRFNLSQLGQGEHTNFYVTMGRLQADASLAMLDEELRAFDAAEVERQGRDFGFTLQAQELRSYVVGSTRDSLLVLWAAVGLVLLIACANVTNLLLARSARRRRESTVRAALGAGRWTLMRQYLSESLVLALIGSAAGVALALLLVALLKTFSPRLPYMEHVGLNLQVLLFTLALTVLSALLAGLIPAWKASRPSGSLSPNARQEFLSQRSGRLPALLNAVQVAVAVTLLVGAGLLLRSFWQLTSVDPGFRSRSALAAGIALPSYRFPEPARRFQLMEQIVRRLQDHPGVRSAAAAQLLPMVGGWSKMLLRDEETPEHVGELTVSAQAATPGYFRTMGIGLRGRDFQWNDRADSREVVIVNQRFAEIYWPGEDPVGKVLPRSQSEIEVIGVADDVRFYGLDNEVEPTWYFPLLQSDRAPSYFRLVILPEQGSSVGAADLRAAVASLAQDVPVDVIGTMTSVIRRTVSRPRFNALLLASFALTAALLAAIGIYGVLSHSVTSRQAEIGVRMALGANTPRILRQVIGQGMAPVLLGLAAGIAAALAIGGVLAGQLFGVRPQDPATLTVIPILLAVVALAACYLPARRASRIDPARSLRAS
ncbi:MAG TPA: ABC transporter permease [Acidobacteriota bacterium]|nr:ABC transporter permease [Acidobacteriota bacterium]